MLKTTVNNASVSDFINSIPDETKKADSFPLIELLEKVTGERPKMWGTSIIGFGMYHYKSERSRQEGDWPLIGFSPRKQYLTLYVTFTEEGRELLKMLGKHKTSVGCLYINKLADIDGKVLEKFLRESFAEAKKIHGSR